LFINLETIINGETSRKQHLNEDLAMDLISEFIFCETNEEGKSTKVIIKQFLFDSVLFNFNIYFIFINSQCLE